MNKVIIYLSNTFPLRYLLKDSKDIKKLLTKGKI